MQLLQNLDDDGTGHLGTTARRLSTNAADLALIYDS